MKWLSNLDLNQAQLQNARIQNVGSDPGTPVEGQLWWRSDSHKPMVWDGTSGHHIGDGGNAASVGGTSLSGLVQNNAYSATTSVLVANSANTPVNLQLGSNTVLGRLSGNVVALAGSDIRTIANVADGATANAKATSVELDTGTDDVKFLTALSVFNSHKVPHVAPGTSLNLMQSNGTDWTSVAVPTWNQSTSGNAATATKFAATKNIAISGGGVTGTATAFDGSSDISITTSLGVITPTSVNGLTLTSNATGWKIAGGTTSKTVQFNKTMTLDSADDTTVATFPAGSYTVGKQIHNLIDTTNHPASGLTTGHHIVASSATGYSFAAPVSNSTTNGIVTASATGLLQNSAVIVNDSGSTTNDLWTASKINTVVNNATAGIASGLHTPVDTLANAKAVGAAARSDKMLMNIENLGLYRYDADSLAVSDDNLVIRPTDIASDVSAGRWLKMASPTNDHANLSNLNSTTYSHLTSAQVTALTAITGIAASAPSNPAAAAVLGSSTLAARENHQHLFQPGFNHVHAYSTGTTDVSNSPYTSTTGTDSVALRAGSNITLSMDAQGAITINSAASGTVGKSSGTIGDGATTNIVYNHGLSTRDVIARVYLNNGTYEEVQVDYDHTDTGNVTFHFLTAPTTAQYRVVVIG
jgi:hypothetical protein